MALALVAMPLAPQPVYAVVDSFKKGQGAPRSRHARSEVGLVGPRRLGVLVGVVVEPLVVGCVFRADAFIPIFPQGAPIRDTAFPRHGEDTFILDREFELQSLALVVVIDSVGRYAGPFLKAPPLYLHGTLVIDEPIAHYAHQTLPVG